jgi:CubicO group peptidase (beta-lactamase class C family)
MQRPAIQSLRIGLLLIFVLYFGMASTKAQNDYDSVRVTGKLKWRDSSIDKLPSKVKITSRYDPFFISSAEIDSLGNYSSVLPIGSYIIAPASKYHWQRDWDQKFIRIDEEKSKVQIAIDSVAEMQIPTLILDTLKISSPIPKKGVLHEFDAEGAKFLDRFITQNLDYYQVPGASLALLKNGEVVYLKNYGVKNPITKEPIEDTTLFEAGSITKAVFAFVVMRLVEKGFIDLDRPLYKYLRYKDVAHDKRYKLITARHVLSHQTGFPNWAERDHNGQFNLLFTPGTRYGYSGEGFEYLKKVVVHVLEKDIDTILKEELLDPLDLNNFYFKTTECVGDYAIDGFYRGRPSKMRFIKEPMIAYSLMTNAMDFTSYALALRNQIGLSDGTYTEMFKGQIYIDETTSWGLGFELGKDTMGNFYGHTGLTRDFVSIYRYYPKLDMGFVFFANNITGGWLTINMLKQVLVTGKQ